MYVVLIFSSAPNALGTGSMASAKRECCGLSLVYYRLCPAFFRKKKKKKREKNHPSNFKLEDAPNLVSQ